MSTFVLMAGGTGGHLFPAMALAQELRRRGHTIHLMTDHRATSYGDAFPAREIHIVPSATPSVRNPILFLRAGFVIAWGIAVAWSKLRGIKADAAVAFGGYPSFPPFVAASLSGLPGVLHEQNAVMGRANHALAYLARVVALSFEKTRRTERFAQKCLLVGNPVRDKVRALAGTPYPALNAEGPLRIVVVAGSQGARAFSDIVPEAVGLIPEAIRHRLQIVQQCRAEDMDRVAETYRQLKVNVELATFFADLPEHIARSHLIICRSGASTIADVCVVGRPMIMVPLPGSIDADQKYNAEVVDDAGGGWIAEQVTLSPLSLATRLASLFGEPEALVRAAAAARSLGQPEAVVKLADVAERLAARGK